MGSGFDGTLSALALMRTWQWWGYDPDGRLFTQGIELSEAVNKLAMEGYSRPQNLVLSLLCNGDLYAVASYKWRKYQWGSHFKHEDHFAVIRRRKWQNLNIAIEQKQIELSGHVWPFNTFDLEKLEIKDYEPYEWVFSQNRFSTASCPPDTETHDKSYFEEWFLAWDIEIRLPVVEDVETNTTRLSDETELIGAPTVGRPLAHWWPDFVAELVAYTVEVGLPDGIGHQGQSEVIKEVCSRLQARGKAEPSRSQIQDAVNALLRRMRSAGN